MNKKLMFVFPPRALMGKRGSLSLIEMQLNVYGVGWISTQKGESTKFEFCLQFLNDASFPK